MELELNHDKMSMKPLGQEWEWYTVRVGRVAIIHVHNRTQSGSWTWEMWTSEHIKANRLYEDKFGAFLEARNSLRGLMAQALERLAH